VAQDWVEAVRHRVQGFEWSFGVASEVGCLCDFDDSDILFILEIWSVDPSRLSPKGILVVGYWAQCRRRFHTSCMTRTANNCEYDES
jgi:hypothetical protein